METLFLTLLNMSISASWLVLAVILFRFVFKKAPKALTCLLWALVAVRLLCPFSVESVLSLIPSAETVPVESLTAETPYIHSGFTMLNSVVNENLKLVPNTPVVVVPSTETQAAVVYTPMQLLNFWATVVWLCGVLVTITYTIISYMRIYRKVRVSVPYCGNIRFCDAIVSPFILGIFRPRIYLPSSVDMVQAEYIIAHERAHLKRRDHWWKPLGFAILTVYWFNPVLWIAYILLCRDIELACDERVIRSMNGEDKKAYTSALLNCSVSRSMVTACPLAFGEVGVKGRIKSVLNYKKPAFWLVAVAIVACIATAICFLTNPPKAETPPPSGETPTSAGVTCIEYDALSTRVQYTTISKNSNPYTDYSVRLFNTKAELSRFAEEYRVRLEENGYGTDNGFEQCMLYYTDEFFEENALLLTFLEAGSGSYEFGITSIWREGNSLTMEATQTNQPYVGTCDMAAWMLTAGVKKSELDGCINYFYKFNELEYVTDPNAVYSKTYRFKNADNTAQYPLLLLSQDPRSFLLVYSSKGEAFPDSIISGQYTISENGNKLYCVSTYHTFTFTLEEDRAVLTGTSNDVLWDTILPLEAEFTKTYDNVSCLYGCTFADIDGDGATEFCIMGAGPHSGRFSFTVRASNENGDSYIGIFTTEFYRLSFAKDSTGKLLIRGETQGDDPKIHFFEVLLENMHIVLEENDNKLPNWGLRGDV